LRRICGLVREWLGGLLGWRSPDPRLVRRWMVESTIESLEVVSWSLPADRDGVRTEDWQGGREETIP
jgi:hypothetical protein